MMMMMMMAVMVDDHDDEGTDNRLDRVLTFFPNQILGFLKVLGAKFPIFHIKD